MTLFTAIKKWLHRMFGKTEEKTVQPVKTKKKLSRADKKQIEAAIARANRTDKKGKSAQDSIPYERMWPDGICRVPDSGYADSYTVGRPSTIPRETRLCRNAPTGQSTISSPKTKIRRQSLRVGVISSIILTARFILGCFAAGNAGV